ncbi:hypothetical protein GC249_10415 [Lactobacillus plantarum]|nr:hypothetical protein [Lactiplantibacillus plantarum]
MKFFVFGYWRKNAGDDLFLNILCKRYPQWKFVISADNKDADSFRQLDNLKVIHRGLIVRIITHFSWKLFHMTFEDLYARFFFKNQIEIGGSIFQETSDWEKQLDRRLRRTRFTSNYLVIGSNFGPVKTDLFLSSYQKFLTQSKIVFRDNYSKDLFNNPDVKVAPDVVFSLKKYFNVERNNTGRKYVAISMIDLTGRVEDKNIVSQFEKKIAQTIHFYLQKKYGVVMMAFCEKEKDLESIQRVCSMLNDIDKIKIEIYVHHRIEKTLQVINAASKIIATRFHAYIIGLTLGKEVLPIVYSEKTRHTLDDIQQWKENPGIDIVAFLNMDIRHMDKQYVSLTPRINHLLQEEASGQFQYLDKVNE